MSLPCLFTVDGGEGAGDFACCGKAELVTALSAAEEKENRSDFGELLKIGEKLR